MTATPTRMMSRVPSYCLLLLVAYYIRSSSSSSNRRAASLLPPQSRRLEDNNNNNAAAVNNNNNNAYDDDNVYFQYDLSEFSVRFEKCQYVKMFDDELLQQQQQDDDDDDSSSLVSPLALKHFVIYRLCPTETCSESCGGSSSSGSSQSSSSSSSSSVVYGQYVTDVESYLKFTVENQQEYLESMCKKCENKCGDNNDNEEEAGDNANNNNNNNNAGIDCSCSKLCDRYENLEEYGYVDASQYLECQQFQNNNNNNNNNNGEDENENNDNNGEDNNNNDNSIYIGPRCDVSGDAISIGLFYDEDCWDPIEDQNVEDVLGAKLSYHLLAQSYYANERVCLTCQELNDDEDEDDNNENAEGENEEQDADDVDEDNVNQMCEDLYKSAAKCESRSGLTNGFIQTNREDGDYENQVENEFMSCNFIDSLVWNSYTETGEINVGAPQDEIIRYVTRKQTIALSFLGTFILCLIGTMEYFRRKIEVTSRRLQLTEPSSTSVFT